MTTFRKLLLLTAGALVLCALQACASESGLNPQPLPPADPTSDGKEGRDSNGAGTNGGASSAPGAADAAAADAADGGRDGAAPNDSGDQ